MKKSFLPKPRWLVTIMFLLTLGINAVWGANATMTAGTAATASTFSSASGYKCGSSSGGGSMTVTIPANATVLSVYIAGWNGDNPSVSISRSSGTISSSSVSPTCDSGISGTGTSYTLANSESTYLKTFTLSNVGSQTTVTFSTSAKKKRFGVWGAKICYSPTSPTNTTIGSTTATLSWTDSKNVNNYEVYYSTSSTAPTAGSSGTTTTSKSINLTSLTASTKYYWWVRAYDSYCKTAWVAGTAFTTTAAATTVSLTKAGQTNGSFTLTQSSTAVTSVTTTSAAQAVTVTATPSAGYYLSNLTASNPTTGTASVTGSGNTRTVTYTKGANGSSTITATFSPIWYLKGDFNDWDASMPLTDITSNVATVDVSLSKTTAYEFKVYNAQEDAWYGNNGKIIDDISGWTFSTSEGNCKVFATVADDYTFKYNISTKAMQVEYPDMTHPNDAYVYLTEWWNCYVHYWYTDGEGDHALVNWGYDTQLSRDVEICGTDYWCVPILDGYPKLIMKDNAGDPSNTTGDQTTASNAGKYITHDGSWGWHDFATYTITFAGNGNTGGSMSNIAGVCPGGSETLPANAFTKTGYTFANWQTDVAVTANSSAVSAGGTIPAGATLSSIGSNITLTAQWTANTITLNLKKNNSDASGSSDGSATINYDATAKTSITAATRTGYTVEGYYTDAACTAANKVLTDAGAVVSGTVSGYTTSGKWTRATTPTDLYAKWTAKSCTVTFDKNSGTGGSNSVTATYGSAMPDITPPTRSGYIFGGYYDSETSNNGSGTQYYKPNGKSAKNWDKNVTSGQTLYARWYGDPLAWCDPDITIEGDIHLTSYKDIYVHSTSVAGNLISISSSDFGSATHVEVAYLDADNSDAEVDKEQSVFRLCNDGSVNYNTIDGFDPDDEWSTTHSIKYTPNAYNKYDNYKLQLKIFNGDNIIKTVTHNLYGRSLPQEFVIASKHNGQWYALPNTMGTSLETVTPIKITVDNTTTPTAATYAPTTTVYKGAARYRQTSNVNSIRLTSTGSNWLETGSTAQLSLSTTASPAASVENKQVWYLKSSNFGAYSLKMDPAQSPAKQLGMSGSYMGMYESPTSPSGDIYLLPITNTFTPRDATVKEWGEHGLIVEADMTNVASATINIDGASPSSTTLTAVNGTLGSTKNVRIDAGALTVGAIANDGKQLYIHWKNSGGSEIAASQIEIPCVIAASGAMKTLIGAKETWAKKEVHILPGKTLTADAGSFGSSAVTIKELHIYPGATLDVTTGTLTATTLRLHSGWTRAGAKQYNTARVHIADNAALVKTTASIDYDIYEASDGQHYYPFAVPFATAVSSIDYADTYLAGFSTYGKHYGIDYYDGATRASGGNSADNWKLVASDATLQPGKGYTIVALPVKGEAIIRVPLTFDNGWTADGEKATYSAVTKNVVAVTGATGEAASSNQRNEGWYMLGVPFMSCYGAGADMYSADGSAVLIDGKIVVTPGEADPYSYDDESVPYVSVPTHDFSEYIQTDITEADLRPGWSFFVQVAEEGNLTFAVSKQQTNDDPTYYAPQRLAESTPVVRTGIILSDGNKSDKTTMLISDKYSAAAYEINADLEKMFGEGYTLATYSLSGDTRLAYNAMSTTDAKGVIPIGFRAPEDGEYTFSLNPRYAEAAVERVDLIDYQKGTLTNLLMEDYTFTTERTQSDERFALNIVVAPKVPTTIENGEADTNGLNVEKVIIDDKMYIIRDKRMYDVTGKRVNVINK